MNLSHHLDDATLLALASGTIAHAHGIVAASHVAMCPVCAKALRKAEAIGGGLLADGGLEPVSDMARAATLASLDGVAPAQRKLKVKSDLPAALEHALGGVSLDQIKWKKKAPGVALFDVPMPKGSTSMLKLLSIGPGRAMPEHGHGGEELTMVLKGSYTDHMGTFGPGDVADLDDTVEHTPVADAGETCICLVAVEAPTRFKSVWARLFQPFVGI
ncbi:MAG: ChrR family anti-sigma-E factor [Aestuariivirga sp.]